jgi:diguanylate cyclase (GGDEF)-like protein/PAS domain S-box-containing protein
MSNPVRKRHRRRLFRLLPWLVLGSGVGLAGLLASHIHQHETEMERAEFAQRTDEIVANLGRRMTSNAQILRGVVGLFAGGAKVSRDGFRHYVESLRLAEYYPGIQAVGYAQFVPARDKARHVAAVRAEGFPDYDITPPGERDAYSPVVFVEPFDWRNPRAFGFDLLGEPARAAAAARARDEGRAVMTGKLTLRQETEQDTQAGALLLVPVYRTGTALETAEQRRAALLGWVYSALRMKDLLGGYLNSEYAKLSGQAAIRVYAGEAPAPDALMYDSHPAMARAADSYVVTRTAPIQGIAWTVQVEPLPSYWGGVAADGASRMVLLAGIALSLALAFATHAMVSRHVRVAVALRETHRANRSLAEQEALLRAVYDSSGVGIYLVNLDCMIVHANQYMATMFDCPLEDLIGKSYYSLLPPIERKLARRRFDKMLAGEEPILNLERRYRRQDKSEFWGQVTAQPFHDDEGRVVGIVGVVADTTERRQMEEALRLSEMRHRLLADNASEVIWTLDIQGRLTYVSPSVERLRGHAVEQAMRQPLSEWFTPASLPPALEAIGRALEAVRTGQPLTPLCVELQQTRADGSAVWTETMLSGFYDGKGRAVGVLGVTRDITERKQTQDRIAHLAHYDTLTNLCNRALFFDRVEQALALARRERSRLALMYIDLDKFKPVNDTYGHPVGDLLLAEVAERMRGCVRASDTVGRIGGDEFVALLPRLAAPGDALAVAEKIRWAVRQPFELAGHSLSISTSIGIAVYPEHGEVELELSKNADIAMYRVKEGGGDNVRIYEEAMRAEAADGASAPAQGEAAGL